MVNKFIANGRLVKDPELKQTTNSVSYCYFSIAVPRDYKDLDGNRKSDFISCVAYRKTAEILCQYAHKGDLIGIEGRLQVELKETENSSKWITNVLIEHFDFLSQTKENAQKNENAVQNNSVNDSENSVNVQNEQQVSAVFKDFGENLEIDESELPF